MNTVHSLRLLLISVRVHSAPSPLTNKKKRKFCSLLNSHGRTIVPEHCTECFKISGRNKYLELLSLPHFRMTYYQCLEISVDRTACIRSRSGCTVTVLIRWHAPHQTESGGWIKLCFCLYFVVVAVFLLQLRWIRSCDIL